MTKLTDIIPKPRKKEMTGVVINDTIKLMLPRDRIMPFILFHSLWNSTKLTREEFLDALKSFLNNEGTYQYYENCFNAYMCKNKDGIDISPALPIKSAQVFSVTKNGWAFGVVLPLNTGIDGIKETLKIAGFDFFEFMATVSGQK